MSVQISIKEIENIKGMYAKLFNEHEELKKNIVIIAT